MNIIIPKRIDQPKRKAQLSRAEWEQHYRMRRLYESLWSDFMSSGPSTIIRDIVYRSYR